MDKKELTSLLDAQIEQPRESRNDKILELLTHDSAIKKGERNSKLFSIACGMRANGHDEPELVTSLLDFNDSRCSPPLSEEEIRSIAKSACRYPKGSGRYKLNDIGNGERMADHCRGKLLFCPENGKFLVFDGLGWRRKHGCAEQFAKEVVNAMLKEARETHNDDLKKHAGQTANGSRFREMIARAASEEGMSRSLNDFDTDPMVLAVTNGIVDLRTGEMRDAQAEDYITMRCNVAFEKDVRCPRFMELLNSMFDNDSEMIAYIQKLAGYSLTGRASERAMFQIYGPGRCGKSTLAETIAWILGDYAAPSNPTIIMTKSGSDNTNDLAALKGKRLVTMSEFDDTHRVSEAVFKRVTGNEKISVRFLYQEPFGFVPGFKLLTTTNRLPSINGNDQSTFDRMHIIPVGGRVEEDEQDLDLREKLMAEGSGILNFALEGCLRWQKEGLRRPTKVVEATSIYKNAHDSVGRFLDDRTLTGGQTRNENLYNAYQRWCLLDGATAESKPTFGRVLVERGHQNKKKGGQWYRIGITLNAESEPQSEGD